MSKVQAECRHKELPTFAFGGKKDAGMKTWFSAPSIFVFLIRELKGLGTTSNGSFEKQTKIIGFRTMRKFFKKNIKNKSQKRRQLK